LARYLAVHQGAEAVAEVARGAQLSPEELDGRTHWVTRQQFESVLASSRARMESDEEFIRASCFELKESWGALRFVMRATSVGLVYELAAKTIHMVSSISAYERERTARNALTLRYATTRSESRLVCLSRVAALTSLPTFFELPPARLTESSCVANGDRCCEYHLQWHDERRWLPNLVGAVLGFITAIAVTRFEPSTASWISMPLLGWALGQVYELRRTSRVNALLDEETKRALAGAMRECDEARRETLAFQQRHWQWADAEPTHEGRASETKILGHRGDAANGILDVATLADSMTRRLLALTYSSQIRSSVVVTREAPEHVAVDAQVFDRIIDAVLTNAARFTERGSIVVEVGGSPGHLTIKVADTGSGFESPMSRIAELLTEIGGRADVMSKPAIGTTYWLHFPMSRTRTSTD
jgi:hypothetical protein